MRVRQASKMGLSQWMVSIFLGLNFLGCQAGKTLTPSEEAAVSATKSVVVVGFSPAMNQGELPDVVRSPVTGSAFMAQPVSSQVATMMTDKLYQILLDDERWKMIPPGQARGVYESILGSDQKMGMSAVQIIEDVGKTFGTDAVLGGSVYRWRDRRGSDYAVDFPASVAFDLWLVRSSDGALLWKGKYDKTQQSLMENLLDFSTFAESDGKWLTAEKLAMIGLRKLIEEMPGAPVKIGEKGVDLCLLFQPLILKRVVASDSGREKCLKRQSFRIIPRKWP